VGSIPLPPARFAPHTGPVPRTQASLLLAILPLACVAPIVDIAPGQVGAPCRTSEPLCDTGLICSEAAICFDSASPCSGYDCGEGSCREVDDMPFCECPAGSIHAVGSEPCRAASFSIRPPPGLAGGLCLAPDGHCEDDRLECNRDGNYCFHPDDPCVGFACGGTDRGRCEPRDGQPSCLCFEGFENESFALYCCPVDGGDPYCT
jgi:hypothetical protein